MGSLKKMMLGIAAVGMVAVMSVAAEELQWIPISITTNLPKNCVESDQSVALEARTLTCSPSGEQAIEARTKTCDVSAAIFLNSNKRLFTMIYLK